MDFSTVYPLYTKTGKEKLPTYPSPNPTFCPKWDANDNAELGEGWVGSSTESLTDPKSN